MNVHEIEKLNIHWIYERKGVENNTYTLTSPQISLCLAHIEAFHDKNNKFHCYIYPFQQFYNEKDIRITLENICVGYLK